jgi:hypothetical protein
MSCRGSFSLELPLYSNLCSFGAVICRCRFLEPWVLQGLLCRDAICRVIDEDLFEQVKKITAEFIIFGGDNFLPPCQLGAKTAGVSVILPQVSSSPSQTVWRLWSSLVGDSLASAV